MFSVSGPVLLPVSQYESFQALAIMGATATGKTQLALELAEKVPIEVISVDSVQIYRGMDIGTAKVTLEERGRVAHHLIDICPVCEPYNLASFLNDVVRVLPEILQRGNLPVFVGGTGFYFEGLFRGLPPTPHPDEDVRRQLQDDLNREGLDSLHQRLVNLDPLSASAVSKRDRHRILRSLEVILVTGKPLHLLDRKQKIGEPPLPTRVVNLEVARNILRERVLVRCDQMVEAGLLQEVKNLIPQGIKKNHSARKAIGYSHFLDYIDGHVSFDESICSFKQVSCQLIKKQETWSRSRNRLIPVEHLSSREGIDNFINQFCVATSR
ncbi:tRNA (adenosine(37)-N6)-dimethylallyltransferase MiaA [Candidatus Similichlamydia epinepheli]|uniref:tRNA (adenosine(37)-N6)-dimethylallyltransferase MiaA n=1 Tax=Candidatus Similichlamydia epinepheli TaxID=1903953 RepID=UPI000D354CBD|nr:tRNA (adenosine(37)-N6)-dimethylallyltransferase MiaA [Candidatus Similichlamydia epinepheli]